MKTRKITHRITSLCDILLLAVILSGCGKQQAADAAFAGTWQAEEGLAAYEFLEDGTGYTYVKSNPDAIVNLTYYVDGDKVVIEKVGGDTRAELTISEEDGETVLYNKQQQRIIRISQ